MKCTGLIKLNFNIYFQNVNVVGQTTVTVAPTNECYDISCTGDISCVETESANSNASVCIRSSGQSCVVSILIIIII